MSKKTGMGAMCPHNIGSGCIYLKKYPNLSGNRIQEFKKLAYFNSQERTLGADRVHHVML